MGCSWIAADRTASFIFCLFWNTLGVGSSLRVGFYVFLMWRYCCSISCFVGTTLLEQKEEFPQWSIRRQCNKEGLFRGKNTSSHGKKHLNPSILSSFLSFADLLSSDASLGFKASTFRKLRIDPFKSIRIFPFSSFNYLNLQIDKPVTNSNIPICPDEYIFEASPKQIWWDHVSETQFIQPIFQIIWDHFERIPFGGMDIPTPKVEHSVPTQDSCRPPLFLVISFRSTKKQKRGTKKTHTIW